MDRADRSKLGAGGEWGTGLGALRGDLVLICPWAEAQRWLRVGVQSLFSALEEEGSDLCVWGRQVERPGGPGSLDPTVVCCQNTGHRVASVSSEDRSTWGTGSLRKRHSQGDTQWK